MSGASLGDVQRTIDFLLRLSAREVDWARLPCSVDDAALVRLAKEKGVETNAAAVRKAFATIMRARLVAAAAGAQE